MDDFGANFGGGGDFDDAKRYACSMYVVLSPSSAPRDKPRKADNLRQPKPQGGFQYTRPVYISDM